MGFTIMDNNIKDQQPFVSSCVDAGQARDGCGDLFDQMCAIKAYLAQGKQYFSDEEALKEFESSVNESIGDLEQISNRLRRSEEQRVDSTTDLGAL
jgi:hypothetical protein